MLSYEVQSAISNAVRDKAEKYEVNDLKNEISRLREEVREANRKCDRLSNELSNTKDQVRILIDGIIEHYSYMIPEPKEDFISRLEQIRNQY